MGGVGAESDRSEQDKEADCRVGWRAVCLGSRQVTERTQGDSPSQPGPHLGIWSDGKVTSAEPLLPLLTPGPHSAVLGDITNTNLAGVMVLSLGGARGGHGQGSLSRKLPRAASRPDKRHWNQYREASSTCRAGTQGTGGRILRGPGDLRVELRKRMRVDISFFPHPGGAQGSPCKSDPVGLLLRRAGGGPASQKVGRAQAAPGRCQCVVRSSQERSLGRLYSG